MEYSIELYKGNTLIATFWHIFDVGEFKKWLKGHDLEWTAIKVYQAKLNKLLDRMEKR